MYICPECSALFERSKHVTERHGLGTPPFEEQDVCPRCGGLAWKEAFRCDCCGEFVTGRYVRIDSGERYCDECYIIKEIDDD